MTAGTKIFLAIVAVLVAVLVVYYGFLMDDDTPALVMEESTSPEAEAVDEVTEAVSSAPSPRVERRDEPERVLVAPRDEPDRSPEPAPESEPQVKPELEPDTEIQPADDPESPEDEKQDEAPVDPLHLDDHLPVTVINRVAEDGGKDMPDSGAGDDENVEHDAHDEDAHDEDDAPDEVVPDREADREQDDSPERPQFTEYVVRSGDTMSSIATDWFDDAGKWDLIAKANPFVDPNRLTVGQVLRLPPKDAQREDIEGRAGDTATIYVVRSGDNLTKIARAYYNDAGLWRLIYQANRETIGDNPARLRVGMRLTIPPAPRPAEGEENQE